MVVAERVVREHHRDPLAEVVHHPRRHGRDLRPNVGDAGLEHVAVEHAGGDVRTLADHEIRNLQFTGPGGGADDHVREQRAVHEVHLVLTRQLLDHFRAALRVGPVVLGDDLDRPPRDTAGLVHVSRGRVRGALVPAPVGGADAGAVHLEPDPDRRVASGCVSGARDGAGGDRSGTGHRHRTGRGRGGLEQTATRELASLRPVLGDRSGVSSFVVHRPLLVTLLRLSVGGARPFGRPSYPVWSIA